MSILPRAVDRTRPIPPARLVIDNDYYEEIDDQQWWDARGPAAILHAINGPRLRFYRAALGDLRGRLVLDAGCGGGLVAKGLAEAGAIVVGLDQSPSSLQVARRVLAPGGSLAFDTINRTVWAWFTTLWGAERLLGLLPRGTHDWRLLIRPGELDVLLRGAGLTPVATAGLAPAVGPADIARGLLRRRIDLPEFRIGSDRRASYLGHYRKTGPGEEGVHP